MSQPRRSFTPEFKQEAVDLCRRSGKSECQKKQRADKKRGIRPGGVRVDGGARVCDRTDQG